MKRLVAQVGLVPAPMLRLAGGADRTGPASCSPVDSRGSVLLVRSVKLNRPNLRLVGARCARDVRFALARRLAPAFGGLLLLTAAAAAQAKPAPEGFADLAQ